MPQLWTVEPSPFKLNLIWSPETPWDCVFRFWIVSAQPLTLGAGTASAAAVANVTHDTNGHVNCRYDMVRTTPFDRTCFVDGLLSNTPYELSVMEAPPCYIIQYNLVYYPLHQTILYYIIL